MRRSFYIILSLSCLIYFSIQLFYTAYAMLSVDEFWFAHWIYQYKSGIPYRDFSPYKTVLGYYFLLPVMLFSHDILTPLYSIKNTFAVINTFLFFSSAIWLKKFFSKEGVLISIVILMFTEFVLTYSTNIRVDFLSYWFCFFSALCLLERRMFFAGILMGLGFLISQKALWYIVASNAALAIYWLCYLRNVNYFRKIILFNLTLILLVLTYILIWSYFSDLTTVLKNMFHDAYVMYKLDTYDSARPLYWSCILTYNPLVFLLWPVTLLSLIILPENAKSHSVRVFSIIFSSTIMLCLIPYKQVFPYYMLTTVPAFLLLYPAFFSWILQIFSAEKIKIIYLNKSVLYALSILYFCLLIYLKFALNLPVFYIIFGFIPFILITRTVFINQLSEIQEIFLRYSFWFIVLIIGFIFPFLFFVRDLPLKNGEYQKNMVYLADHLLKKDEDYIAGIEIFYNKNQPIQSLRHLDLPGLRYLYTQDSTLRESMLPSLYHTPDASIPGAITSLQQSHVKLLLNNYRMEALPKKIKHYLASQYEHYWGSIYLYAPTILKGNQIILIKFTGQYQLQSHEPVQLNHKTLLPNASIQLKAGKYFSHANSNYRLKFIPENTHLLLQDNYRDDSWQNMLW